MTKRPAHGLPARARLALVAASLLVLPACAASGQAGAQPVFTELPAAQAPTYADLVELALAAPVVGVVRVEDQAPVEPERAPGLAPGSARLYLETVLTRLLAAPGAMGESLSFVVDRPLDARGRPPSLRNQSFLVFAVPARAGALQLLSSEAMLPTGPQIEGRVETVLRQLAEADAPAQVTGVSGVIWVPGNLAGESETQFLVETEAGAPVSITVIRRPGMAPAWGVSLGEIVDQAARPPAPETLAWYRLACGLPRELGDDAFLQTERDARTAARADYAFVLEALGPCARRLPAPPAR